MKRGDYPFWIKERHNPQLGVYYVACGQMSVSAAKRCGSTLFGSNTMHRFDEESAFNARLEELRAAGESVQN